MTGANELVPLVFILIIGTVVLQSATARPFAKWLKVADPDPNGVMIFGSDLAARTVAQALIEQKFRVLVVDDDWDGIRAARMAGLPTFYGNPTSQHADLHMDLTGIGHLLAMSTRREFNSLTCMQYRQVFGRENVYRLRVLAPAQTHDRAEFAGSIQSKALFQDKMTHARFCELLSGGWRVKATQLTETFDWPQYLEQNGADSVLMFGVETNGHLNVASNKREIEPKPGWTVLVLVLVPAGTPDTSPQRSMPATAEA